MDVSVCFRMLGSLRTAFSQLMFRRRPRDQWRSTGDHLPARKVSERRVSSPTLPRARWRTREACCGCNCQTSPRRSPRFLRFDLENHWWVHWSVGLVHARDIRDLRSAAVTGSVGLVNVSADQELWMHALNLVAQRRRANVLTFDVYVAGRCGFRRSSAQAFREARVGEAQTTTTLVLEPVPKLPRQGMGPM